MSPRSLVLFALLACNPVPPGGEPGTTTGGSTTGADTDGLSSSAATATPTTTGGSAESTGPSTDTTGTDTTLEPSTTTDAVSTTSGDTTMEPPSPTSWTTNPGDDTTEGFVCNWQSEPEGHKFCPQAAAPNASLSGTTPIGPIDFKFAYFGLYSGCTDCPYASEGTLAFFNEPDDAVDPKSDILIVGNYLGFTLDLVLGGEYAGIDASFDESEAIVVFMDVDVPSVTETNPPLDPGAPPTLSGKLSITGGGWDVSGEFIATLCRPLDRVVYCG